MFVAQMSRKSTWTMRSLPMAGIRAPEALGAAWSAGRTASPDLVEQQRAAFGHLEQAFLVHRRAGKGALLVPEQLGLDQILGIAAQLILMNGPFERLLL